MLQAVVIDNGIEGLDYFFPSKETVQYRFERVRGDFNPDLSGADVLIVPNGSDHVAMAKIKEKVREFLDRGKAVMCFDGWFTDWVPGNRWVMDTSKKTIDIRYFVKTDRHNLFNNVDINQLTFSHGISGWWACGYIDAATNADVLIEDTWGRPIIVLDETSTPGIIILTASGPLGDATFSGKESDLVTLYNNFLNYVAQQQITNTSHNEPQQGARHEENRIAL